MAYKRPRTRQPDAAPTSFPKKFTQVGFDKCVDLIYKLELKSVYCSLGVLPVYDEETGLVRNTDDPDPADFFKWRNWYEAFINSVEDDKEYRALYTCRPSAGSCVKLRACHKVGCPWCHVRNCLRLRADVRKAVESYPQTSFGYMSLPDVVVDINSDTNINIAYETLHEAARTTGRKIWRIYRPYLAGMASWVLFGCSERGEYAYARPLMFPLVRNVDLAEFHQEQAKRGHSLAPAFGKDDDLTWYGSICPYSWDAARCVTTVPEIKELFFRIWGLNGKQRAIRAYATYGALRR